MKTCWQILGIEPTKDKTEIKKAYAKLIAVFHPEENPEKFQEIQQAYKQALNYAKTGNMVSKVTQSNSELITEKKETNVTIKKEVKTSVPRIKFSRTLSLEEEIKSILNQLEAFINKPIELRELEESFKKSNFLKYHLEFEMINGLMDLLDKYKNKLSLDSLEVIENIYKTNDILANDVSIAILSQIKAIKNNEEYTISKHYVNNLKTSFDRNQIIERYAKNIKELSKSTELKPKAKRKALDELLEKLTYEDIEINEELYWIIKNEMAPIIAKDVSSLDLLMKYFKQYEKAERIRQQKLLSKTTKKATYQLLGVMLLLVLILNIPAFFIKRNKVEPTPLPTFEPINIFSDNEKLFIEHKEENIEFVLNFMEEKYYVKFELEEVYCLNKTAIFTFISLEDGGKYRAVAMFNDEGIVEMVGMDHVVLEDEESEDN